ncbi:Serine/threonine-protein kinase PknK [compost metagenome]
MSQVAGPHSNTPKNEPGTRLFMAKLQPPHRPGRIVARSHLFEPLLTALPAGLMLVTAPAGFGKTTLLGQIHDWMLDAGIATGWLSLERADDEFGRFVAYLRAAMAPVLQGAEHSPVGVADSPLADAMELTEQIAASDKPFALFLDDLHAVHNADILGLLSRLLSVLGPAQRLMVGTRELPMLDVHRLRANGKAVELDARKLRFSLEETRAFLQQAQLDALPEVDMQYLHERTEGWAAAVQLAALALVGSQESPRALLDASLSVEQNADYLAHEVFMRQPPELQDFLLRTSILETFCIELCDALSGQSNSWEMIRRVENSNLFISAIDSRKQWYRFHQMFAGFLRQQLSRRKDIEQGPLHVKAANWLRGEGHWARAVEHALLGQHNELAAAIMNECAEEFLAYGRATALAQWCNQIPVDLVVRNPALHASATLALISLHRHEEARALIQRFLEQSPLLDDARSARVLALQAFQVVWSDRLDEIDPCLAQAQACEAQLEPVFWKWTLRNCAAYLLLLDNHLPQARRLAVTAKGALLKIGGLASMVYSDTVVAMSDLLQGEVRSTIVYLERALESWEPPGERFCTSNTTIAALLAEANYLVRAFTPSRELLDIFMPLIKEGAFPEVLICSLRVRTRIAQMDGEPERAIELLNDLESLGEQRNLPRVVASAWLERARLALLAGNSAAARRHLEMADQAGCWDKAKFLNTFANDVETPQIGTLRCRIAEGDGSAAAELQGLLDQALQERRLMRALTLRILLAQALWLGHCEREAVAQMQQALADAVVERLVQPFVDEPWGLAPPLNAALATPGNLPASFLDELCAACNLATGGQPSPSAGEAAAGRGVLSCREVEVLEMVAAGLSNKEIARNLFRSEATVATHLRNIYAKLEANGRMQAILAARQRGLLD